MNCDELFDAVMNLDDPNEYSLFDLAQCFIAGYDPAKLRQLLQSPDLGVASDGLFILGEIGSLARQYLPEISTLAMSADSSIRKEAERLAALYSETSVMSGDQ